jgi:uncharacterized protein YoxC
LWQHEEKTKDTGDKMTTQPQTEQDIFEKYKTIDDSEDDVTNYDASIENLKSAIHEAVLLGRKSFTENEIVILGKALEEQAEKQTALSIFAGLDKIIERERNSREGIDIETFEAYKALKQKWCKP